MMKYASSSPADATSAIIIPRQMPALDGMRAVAISLVLLAHGGLQYIVPGGLGVIVFFVISGFLITHLMLTEIADNGRLDIKRFYFRRFLRLAPTIIILVLLFVPLLRALGATITTTHIFSALFYGANYFHMYIGYPPYSPFPILWSLAVEEHYYIVFPCVILVCRKHLRQLLPWLFVSVILVLAWRYYLNAACNGAMRPYALCGLPDNLRIYKGTDSILDCILYGAITAFLTHFHSGFIRHVFLNKTAFTAACAVMLSTLLYRDADFRDTLRYTLQAIGSAIIMINILFGQLPKLKKLLELPLLTTIGNWSYGLYVYHFAVAATIAILRGRADGLSGSVDHIAFVVATFLLAALSYRWVDLPMRKLRRRFGSKAGL